MSDTSPELLVDGATTPRGRYPHVRRIGPWLFVSGTSARQPDNTVAGVIVGGDGTVQFDIAEQTRAVLATIERYLAAAGATLADLVDLTTFLVDMADFDGYNITYNTVFGNIAAAPARTTVAVRELPHPHLRVEIKATAYLEREQP